MNETEYAELVREIESRERAERQARRRRLMAMFARARIRARRNRAPQPRPCHGDVAPAPPAVFHAGRSSRVCH